MATLNVTVAKKKNNGDRGMVPGETKCRYTPTQRWTWDIKDILNIKVHETGR